MHIFFMHRCLELAEKGRGKTGINPMVGAMLFRDGKVIAEGFHSAFGKAHAEADMIKKFDQEFHQEDIFYTNLEPCCHSNKKTPPCTDLIIQSGIKKIVYGMRDPNPQVSGKGIEALKKAGVDVVGPVLEDECLRLNRGFVSLHTHHRPWITLKIARTVDGKIANDDGSMMKITTKKQNAWSHEFLRARHDAILVGVGTILSDDSRLTVRGTPLPSPHPRPLPPAPAGAAGGGGTQPYRIILDSRLRIPLTANVVSDHYVSRTIVVCSPDAASKKKSELGSRGVRVIEISTCGSHCFDWLALWKALTTPKDSFYGISSILVEGGPKTWETFRKAGMLDEEVTLMGV